MKKLTQYINEYLIKKKLDKVHKSNTILDIITNIMDLDDRTQNFINNYINENNVIDVKYYMTKYDYDRYNFPSTCTDEFKNLISTNELNSIGIYIDENTQKIYANKIFTIHINKKHKNLLRIIKNENKKCIELLVFIIK